MTKVKLSRGKPVACSKCGKPGGTLVRVDDNVYIHQNKELCRILGWRKQG